MKTLIPIADIDFANSPQMRAETRTDVISEYAESYQTDAKMPPVKLFQGEDEKRYLIADGWHRCLAQKQLGRERIEAEVHQGNYSAALQYALRANTDHGLRRSASDKRKCVTVALIEYPKVSNARIAQMCQVSDHTVADVRSELEQVANIAKFDKRASSDGRQMPATRSTPRKCGVLIAPGHSNEVVLDAHGDPIPKEVLKLWSRGDESREMLSNISSIINFLKHTQKQDDPLYAEINFSSVISEMSSACANLKLAVPHCLCTLCNGKLIKGCRMCFGRGFLSKFRYDTIVTAEDKAMAARKRAATAIRETTTGESTILKNI